MIFYAFALCIKTCCGDLSLSLPRTPLNTRTGAPGQVVAKKIGAGNLRLA